jgi:hypothetical protein
VITLDIPFSASFGDQLNVEPPMTSEVDEQNLDINLETLRLDCSLYELELEFILYKR